MENFLIRKGFHRSNKIIPRFHKNLESIEFVAIFDSNCNYDLKNDNNLDINKLYGISWGWHHKDSFRIGWNIKNNKISLFSYYYNDGYRRNEELCQIDFNEPIIFKIRFHKGLDAIIVDWIKSDKTKGTEAIEYYFPETNYGYYLWPYFGGNEVAPHKMRIRIFSS